MTLIKSGWNVEECNRRHKWIGRTNTVILAVLGLQMMFIGWSIQASTSAAAKVESISDMTHSTTIRVEENWQSSLRQLTGVRDALKDIQASQIKSDDRIIDELKCNRVLVEKLMMSRTNGTRVGKTE